LKRSGRPNREAGSVNKLAIQRCMLCRGTGKVQLAFEETCRNCGGRGFIDLSKLIQKTADAMAAGLTLEQAAALGRDLEVTPRGGHEAQVIGRIGPKRGGDD